MSGLGYVVTANYGDRVTAVRTVDVMEADEFEVHTVRASGGDLPAFLGARCPPQDE